MSRSAVVRTLYALAQRPNGVSSTEAAEATGKALPDVLTYLKWMADTGRVTKRAVREGRVRSRLYADPNETLQAVEIRIQARNRASRAAQVAASNLATKGLLALPRSDGGPKIEYRVIGGRRVKCTVDAGHSDPRYTVHPGEFAPLFGCLGAGRYLERGETWASRAYGGRA